MTELRLYGFDVTGIATFEAGGRTTCNVPAPDSRFLCTLPNGHQPAGDHEVQVPALVTIIRFRSDLETTMPTTEPTEPTDPKRDAGKKRAERGDIAARPARPRTTPTPRDVRPHSKPDER